MEGPRPAFLKLSCAVQTYAWGKVGLAGEVAKLKSTDPGFSVKEEQPYAEVSEGGRILGCVAICCAGKEATPIRAITRAVY